MHWTAKLSLRICLSSLPTKRHRNARSGPSEIGLICGQLSHLQLLILLDFKPLLEGLLLLLFQFLIVALISIDDHLDIPLVIFLLQLINPPLFFHLNVQGFLDLNVSVSGGQPLCLLLLLSSLVSFVCILDHAPLHLFLGLVALLQNGVGHPAHGIFDFLFSLGPFLGTFLLLGVQHLVVILDGLILLHALSLLFEDSLFFF